MKSLSVGNQRFIHQYQQWSYSCHQRRMSEIKNRQFETIGKNLEIIDSCRRNKFVTSRKKEINKQEKILHENRILLKKIVNIRSSFYRSSSRSSIKSNGSNVSNRSIESKQYNNQRIKDNSVMKSKLLQIKSTLKSMISDTSSRGSFKKRESQQTKCLQIRQINQVKLLSLPSVRIKSQTGSYQKDFTGIVQTLPSLKSNRQSPVKKIQYKYIN